MRRPLSLVMVGLLVTACAGGPDVPSSAPLSPSPAASASAAASPTPAATPAAPSPAAPSPSAAPRPVGAPPPVADDPAALAVQLTRAERTIRSSTTDARAIEQAGVLQQAAYRVLAARPQWRAAVLAALPEDLRATARAHADALAELRRLTRPQRRLPSWRIVAPPPPEQLLAHYREAERELGIGWEYLAAIHLVETRMGRIRGTSSAGARGPMQFMPATWAAYGKGDIENPRDAIFAAARYLRASGGPRNMSRALFAYNRSDAYVRGVEVHAAQMRADERTYRGYYHWQVYYRTTSGDRVLPVGYDGRRS